MIQATMCSTRVVRRFLGRNLAVRVCVHVASCRNFLGPLCASNPSVHGRSNIHGERSYTVDTLRPVAGNIFPPHQQYPVEAPPPAPRSSFSAMMTGLTGAFLAVVIGAAAIMNAGESKTDHAAAAGAQAPAMIAAPVAAAPVAAAPVAATPATPAAAAVATAAAPATVTPADPTDEPGTATGTRKIKKRRIKGTTSAPSTPTPATTTRPTPATAAPAPAANAADNKEATDTLMRALAERPL
jgi:hypothetical protein